MNLFPRTSEEWRNLIPNFFKIYIAAAYIAWKLCSVYVLGGDSPFSPPPQVIAGYILGIIVLAFLTGFLISRRQIASAAQASFFIALAIAFLSISFLSAGVLKLATFFVDLTIYVFVFGYTLNAQRSLKMRALTFWICACAINLVREIGLFWCNYSSPSAFIDTANIWRANFWWFLPGFAQGNFIEFYWLGSLLAGVLYVAGIILVIKKLQAKGQFIPSPDTAMFVALGFLASMVLLGFSEIFLQQPELLPAIAINAVTLYFCLTGYRRFKFTALIFLALAAILVLARVFGLYLLNRYHDRIHNGAMPAIEQLVMELILLSGIAAIVLWGMGITFLVRRLRNHEVKTLAA